MPQSVWEASRKIQARLAGINQRARCPHAPWPIVLSLTKAEAFSLKLKRINGQERRSEPKSALRERVELGRWRHLFRAQFVQQQPRIHQISGVKSLCEPIVGGSE